MIFQSYEFSDSSILMIFCLHMYNLTNRVLLRMRQGGDMEHTCELVHQLKHSYNEATTRHSPTRYLSLLVL